MKYFSLELSKKLDLKGLVSGSKTYYGQYSKELTSYKTFDFDDLTGSNSVNTPAFTLSDIILNKENLIKLYGDEIDFDFTLITCASIEGNGGEEYLEETIVSESEAWGLSLLRLHLSGGDIEQELLKVL